MKIDDVSLTIFTWDNIPATNYHTGTATAGASNLGLLRILTDSGLEGFAFLGSATNPASMDGPQLIRTLKPMLMGQNPLERERIHAGMRLINRAVSYRTIGAVDTALWDLAGKIAGLPGTCADGDVPDLDPRLRKFAGAAGGFGVRGAGAGVQGGGLAGLQDPSAAGSGQGYQGMRGGAQGGRG